MLDKNKKGKGEHSTLVMLETAKEDSKHTHEAKEI